MLDCLCSGKLIKDTKAGTSGTGTHYTQFMLSVSCGEPQPIVITGVAFGDVAERIAKLKKGDSLAVIGSLKPTEWTDKNTGETKRVEYHGEQCLIGLRYSKAKIWTSTGVIAEFTGTKQHAITKIH